MVTWASAAQAQDPLAEKVTVDLNGVAAFEAFKAVASAMGVGVTVSPSVTDPVNIAVRNVTARTALNAMCESIGCRWNLADGILVVKPVRDSAADTQQKVRVEGRATTQSGKAVLEAFKRTLPGDMKFDNAPLEEVSRRLTESVGLPVKLVAAGSAFGLAAAILFVVGGLWLVRGGVGGYVIASAVDPSGVNNPLAKLVAVQPDAWISSFAARPWMWLAPGLGVFGLASAALLIRGRWELGVLILSGLGVAGVIATAGCAMFPFILPSSLDPQVEPDRLGRVVKSRNPVYDVYSGGCVYAHSDTYTAWVYQVLRGKVNLRALLRSKESY